MALDIVLLWGPRNGLFPMSEVPLYSSTDESAGLGTKRESERESDRERGREGGREREREREREGEREGGRERERERGRGTSSSETRAPTLISVWNMTLSGVYRKASNA